MVEICQRSIYKLNNERPTESAAFRGPLRSRSPKQGRQASYAGLTRSLRTAQNEAIHHMAGAFHTTVDPLLQLMGIMPIDIHIKKLIKNASLRLYRLPLNSQLLARVSGPWGPSIHCPPCHTTTCRASVSWLSGGKHLGTWYLVLRP